MSWDAGEVLDSVAAIVAKDTLLRGNSIGLRLAEAAA